MKFKKDATVLAMLFLIPWGIQCLVNNFIPIYIASFPFATERIIGIVTATGSIVTIISQLLWTRAADRSSDRSKALFLSLLLLSIFSVMFAVLRVNSVFLLLLLTVLLYSCYMPHQPLIDTIAACVCKRENYSFSKLRSFASLGYACTGILYSLLPQQNNWQVFFLLIAVLAAVSAVLSLRVKDKNESIESKQDNPNTSNKTPHNLALFKYLVFTFLLFACSSALSTFFPVYFTDASSIGGKLSLFSIIVSASTFLEWGVMLLFSKKIAQQTPMRIHALICAAGILRCAIIFLAKDPLLMGLSGIFTGIWFGLLWSVSTPYLATIVPTEGLTSAQGIWTVIAFGIARVIGTYISGEIAERFGLRNLFLIIGTLLIALFFTTPLFFETTKKSR